MARTGRGRETRKQRRSDAKLRKRAFDSAIGADVVRFINIAEAERTRAKWRLLLLVACYFTIALGAIYAAATIEQNAGRTVIASVALGLVGLAFFILGLVFQSLLIIDRPYPVVLRMSHGLRAAFMDIDARASDWNPIDAAARTSWRLRRLSQLAWALPDYLGTSTAASKLASSRVAGGILSLQDKVVSTPYSDWATDIKAWCVDSCINLWEGSWVDIVSHDSSIVEPPKISDSRRRFMAVAGAFLLAIAVLTALLPSLVLTSPSPIQLTLGLIPATALTVVGQFALKKAGVDFQAVRESQGFVGGFTSVDRSSINEGK